MNITFSKRPDLRLRSATDDNQNLKGGRLKKAPHMQGKCAGRAHLGRTQKDGPAPKGQAANIRAVGGTGGQERGRNHDLGGQNFANNGQRRVVVDAGEILATAGELLAESHQGMNGPALMRVLVARYGKNLKPADFLASLGVLFAKSGQAMPRHAGPSDLDRFANLNEVQARAEQEVLKPRVVRFALSGAGHDSSPRLALGCQLRPDCRVVVGAHVGPLDLSTRSQFQVTAVGGVRAALRTTILWFCGPLANLRVVLDASAKLVHAQADGRHREVPVLC